MISELQFVLPTTENHRHLIRAENMGCSHFEEVPLENSFHLRHNLPRHFTSSQCGANVTTDCLSPNKTCRREDACGDAYWKHALGSLQPSGLHVIRRIKAQIKWKSQNSNKIIISLAGSSSVFYESACFCYCFESEGNCKSVGPHMHDCTVEKKKKKNPLKLGDAFA